MGQGMAFDWLAFSPGVLISTIALKTVGHIYFDRI